MRRFFSFILYVASFHFIFACSDEKAPEMQSNRIPADYKLFNILDDYPALRTSFNTVDEWIVNDLLNDALSDNVQELRDLMNVSGGLPEIETDMLNNFRNVVYRILHQDIFSDPPMVPYSDGSENFTDDFFLFYDKIADAKDLETGERLNLTQPFVAVYRNLLNYLADTYPGEDLEYILFDLMNTLKEDDDGTTVSSLLALLNGVNSKLLLQANDNMWLDSDGQLITEKGSIIKNGVTDTRLGNATRGMDSLLSGINEIAGDPVIRDVFYDMFRMTGDLVSREDFKDALKDLIRNIEDYFTEGGDIYDDPELGRFYHTDNEFEYVNAEIGNNLKELVPMMNLLLIRGDKPGAIINSDQYPLELFCKALHTMDVDVESLKVEESIYKCIRYDDRYRDRLGSSDDPMAPDYASGMNAVEKLLWFLSFANNLGFKPAGSADAEYIDPDVPCDDAFHYTHYRGHGEPTGGIMTINDFLYSVGSATTEEMVVEMMPGMLKSLGMGAFAPYIKNLMEVEFFNKMMMNTMEGALGGGELNVFGMCFDIAAGHLVLRKSALQPDGNGNDFAGQFNVRDALIKWPGDFGLIPGTEKWDEMINDPLNAKYPYYCSTPSYAFGGAGGYGLVGDLGTPWGGRFFRTSESGIEAPWDNPDHNGDGLPDNPGMFVPYCENGLGTVDTVPWMMGFMARACWSGEGPYYYAPEKAGKDPEIDKDGRYIYYCPNGEVYARVDKSDGTWVDACERYDECRYKHLWNSDFFILRMEDLKGVMRYYTYDASLFHNGRTVKESGLGPSICDAGGNPVYDTDYDISCDPTDSKNGSDCNPDYHLFVYNPDCDTGDSDCNPTLDLSKCGDPIEMGREGYSEFLDCVYEHNSHYDPFNKKPPKKPEDIVAGAVPCREFIPGVINSGTPYEEEVTNADRECASQEEAMFKNFKWVLYEKHFMLPLPLPVEMNIPNMMRSKSCGWIVMECNGILALMKARKTPGTWVDERDHSKGYNMDGNARWLIDKGWGYSDKPGDFRIITMQMGSEAELLVPWPLNYLIGKRIPLGNILDSASMYNNIVGFGSMMSDVMALNGKVLESMLFMNKEAIDSILDLPSSTYGPDSPFWKDRNSLGPLLMVFLGALHDDAKKNPVIDDPKRVDEFPFKVDCFDTLSKGLMPLTAKPLAYFQKKGGGTPYNTWKPRLKPPWEGYESNSWDYVRPGPSMDMRWWNGTVPIDEKFAWVDAPITTSPDEDRDGNHYPNGFFPNGGAQIFFEPLGLRTIISMLAESDSKKCDGILTYLKDTQVLTKMLQFMQLLGADKFNDPKGANDDDFETWGARRKILYGLEQVYTTVKSTKGEMFESRKALSGSNYSTLDLDEWEWMFADEGLRDVDIFLDEIVDEVIGSDVTGKGLAVYPDHRDKGHPEYMEDYSWDNFEKMVDAFGALLGKEGPLGNDYNIVPHLIELTEKLLTDVDADTEDLRGLRHTLGIISSMYIEETGKYENPGEIEYILTELIPEIHQIFIGNNQALLKIFRSLLKEEGTLEYFIYSLDSKKTGHEIFEDLYSFLGTHLISDAESALWGDFVELPNSLVKVFDASLNKEQEEVRILGEGILTSDKK